MNNQQVYIFISIKFHQINIIYIYIDRYTYNNSNFQGFLHVFPRKKTKTVKAAAPPPAAGPGPWDPPMARPNPTPEPSRIWIWVSSLDWFSWGKFEPETHGCFDHQIDQAPKVTRNMVIRDVDIPDRAFRFQFSHHPILWLVDGQFIPL